MQNGGTRKSIVGPLDTIFEIHTTRQLYTTTKKIFHFFAPQRIHLCLTIKHFSVELILPRNVIFGVRFRSDLVLCLDLTVPVFTRFTHTHAHDAAAAPISLNSWIFVSVSIVSYLSAYGLTRACVCMCVCACVVFSARTPSKMPAEM